MNHFYCLLCLLLLSYSCSNERPIHSKKVNTINPKLKLDLVKNEVYSKYLNDFSIFLCGCINTNDTIDNLNNLSIKFDNCIKNYIGNHSTELEKLAEFIKKKNQNERPDYEIGYDIGATLGNEGNILLAQNCEFFQNEFGKTKQLMIRELGITSDNVDSKLSIFKNKVKTTKNIEELTMSYLIIGILNEFKGLRQKAKANYAQGLKLNGKNSNLCLIFIELLE